MRAVAAFVIAVSLTGCAANFDETTWVTVRHPGKVSVGVQRPAGGEWLLPADGPRETKEVPDSKPPLTEGRKFATVSRKIGGQVEIDCPSCKGHQANIVVPFNNEIALSGTLEHNVKWDPEQGLAMRYSYNALFPCYRHPSEDCAREAIALWLATQKENVIEVRHQKTVQTSYGERTGAKIGIVVGSVLDAAGLAGVGVAAFDSSGSRPGAFLVAGTFLAVGTTFLLSGIRGVLAKDSNVVVYRGSSK